MLALFSSLSKASCKSKSIVKFISIPLVGLSYISDILSLLPLPSEKYLMLPGVPVRYSSYKSSNPLKPWLSIPTYPIT